MLNSACQKDKWIRKIFSYSDSGERTGHATFKTRQSVHVNRVSVLSGLNFFFTVKTDANGYYP